MHEWIYAMDDWMKVQWEIQAHKLNFSNLIVRDACIERDRK